MKKVYLDGEVKGIIEGRWYITKRRPEHFMKIFQGFGISKRILSQLKAEGIDMIRIIYEGRTGIRVFEAELSAFINSDMIHVFNGNDKQSFVPVRCMIDKFGHIEDN